MAMATVMVTVVIIRKMLRKRNLSSKNYLNNQ
jgi:hypothetical protein